MSLFDRWKHCVSGLISGSSELMKDGFAFTSTGYHDHCRYSQKTEQNPE